MYIAVFKRKFRGLSKQESALLENSLYMEPFLKTKKGNINNMEIVK